MPSSLLPLLLLLPGLLLLTLVEADDQLGAVGSSLEDPAKIPLEGRPVDQIDNQSPPLLTTNALTPFPKQKISKEERQARKLLRKKKKRLRELREEIRKMGSGGLRRTEAKLAVRSRDEKWRRRMLLRLDAITRRLDRLETLIVESTSKTSAKSAEAEKTRKMDRHFASISRSLNGESGMGCASHRDCRPGRCCHAAPTTGAAPAGAAAVAAPTATCVQHDSPEAAGCADSCQCTLQLQCFTSKDNTTQPACKRASSSDILTGTYLNSQDGIF